MGIVKLRPSFKDYLWGGQKLKESYGKETDLKILAESWEVSTHPDGPSYVVDKGDNNETLMDFLLKKEGNPYGEKNAGNNELPVLIKFIDALSNLSIQVHPNDEYSQKHENDNGKTEMWYILEAEPNSKIYYGTKKELSKEEFKQSIEDNTILEKLEHVEVKKGDVIFVEAGTIHAIGAGIVLCEIQQNSNITYRIFDFNRKDVDGNLRELHVDKSLQVSNLSPLNTDFKAQGETIKYDQHSRQLLVTCPYFTTNKIDVDGEFNLNVSQDSFKAVIVIEGKLAFTYKGDTVNLVKGESAFIDAGTENVTVSGIGTYLAVTI